MLETVNFHLQSRGIKITTGTIVDATIIHAPSSTKNREQQRDPEMHQTRKGKQWYFGMKAHIGVDSKHKIVHSAVVTPAHVADCTVLPDLLHGEETKVWGDQAYRGQTEAIREAAPMARDLTNKRYRYKNRVDEMQKAKNRNKSRVRSKVEHVFASDQAEVRLRESSLPGNSQERQSGVYAVRLEQPVCVASQIAVHPDGVVSPDTAQSASGTAASRSTRVQRLNQAAFSRKMRTALRIHSLCRDS